MTKIKLCGMMRKEDIAVVNELMPEYIGFVFAKKSRRYVDPATAKTLKVMVNDDISTVGVFVNEDVSVISQLLGSGVIDMAQLHGSEDEEYIRALRSLTEKPVIKAFQIKTREDLAKAESCSADHILLDAGAGDGRVFDWEWLKGFERPYFLAGGLDPTNVKEALEKLSPYAVDVSSGIETDGIKDSEKMRGFAEAVRGVPWRS